MKSLNFLSVAAISFVSACGGATTSDSVSFQTLSVFSDGAGVARGTNGQGGELYYIAPNIVADVAASNASGPVDRIDINDYPVMSQSAGYNIRQGVLEGATVLVAERIGSGSAQLIYIFDNSFSVIAAGVQSQPRNMPTGSHTYNGIYGVGLRDGGFAELGTAAMTANFTNGTFTLSASSTDTSLSGSGFIDVSNGRISGGTLAFTDVDFGSYTATTYGSIGGANGTEAAGVWHTNDNDPDFAGAYAVSR